jgi:UDPglucose 6-dehydrogenase
MTEKEPPLRVAVIGCGYLGATHAAAMAELGFDVLGVDVVEAKVAMLNEGRSPFHEPGLGDLLASGVKNGRLRFTTSLAEVADWADVHFVCAGTPQRAGELAADTSQVYAVVEGLAPLLTQPTIVIGKSTVPVGTARDLRERLRAAAPAGDAVQLAWNPEFLREGHGVEDTLHPDRLVFGLAENDTVSEAALRQVYADTIADGTPVIVTDLQTAELVKTAANGFLATKISYINAMSEICEAADADVTVLADAIGMDARIGRSFLNAGVGFGGGCLPKDIRAFMARAGELGVPNALGILREVDAVNQRQRQRVVNSATEMLGGELTGSRVAILGAAFKPNSDDVRDSPALNVAGRLHLLGAHVTVYDPAARENAERNWPTLTYTDTMLEACRNADLLIVLTEWDEFRTADPAALGMVVRHRRIIDGRNCLDRVQWIAEGWTASSIGSRVEP